MSTLSSLSTAPLFRRHGLALATLLLSATALQADSADSFQHSQTDASVVPQQRAQIPALSLEMAVLSAQANDHWLRGNRHQQDAIEALSVAAGTLPDPRISLGFANLPTDTMDFEQEGMTQFKVSVAQMLPRGDSLDIKRQQLQQMGNQYPYQRLDRRAQLTVNVTQQWLEAYKAQQSIALIEQDRSLFEQLADVAEASYSTALGRTRQQDIVRAQLELTRLDDRLTVLKQQRDVAIQRLSEWSSNYFAPSDSADTLRLTHTLPTLRLAMRLPDIALLRPELYLDSASTEPQRLYQYLDTHTAVQSLQQKIEASRSGVKLARQKYKPEWGLNASYGYRDQDPMGGERADLFSVGVSFDLPLFTANRQDKEVQSAVSSSEAIRTEKWLLIRKMMAAFEANKAQLLRLNERQHLYREQLLPQMHEQAEASLTSYTNDDGDFAEVVRARIAELNAKIDALSISVERQKARAQLNYFFMSNPNQIIAEALISETTSARGQSASEQESHHE